MSVITKASLSATQLKYTEIIYYIDSHYIDK